jgi:hypothetical protein
MIDADTIVEISGLRMTRRQWERGVGQRPSAVTTIFGRKEARFTLRVLGSGPEVT